MKRTALLIAGLSMFLAEPALAHTRIGTTHGFAAGLGHPFGGADHILAMVGVGLWAFLLGGNARWIVPAAFVTVMAVGGALGMASIGLPMVEAGIAVSILALGLLIALNVKLPVAAAAAIVGLFAIFHGHAHGAEMPDDGSGLAYAVGFILATAILHALGLGIGAGLSSVLKSQAIRTLGAAIATAGAGLAVFS